MLFSKNSNINVNLNVLHHTLHMYDADSLYEAERRAVVKGLKTININNTTRVCVSCVSDRVI